MTYRVGSLFSGYGGLDIALSNVIDTELSWVCDNDRATTTILKHHHPNTPNLGDITRVNWREVLDVDVITAGFPCQDISHSGQKAGITKGKNSGLWRHVIRAASALRPSLIILENVAAITSRGLDTVAGDLAANGYDARWCTLRASDIGAPHQRNRWFAIAHPTTSDADSLRRERARGPRDRRERPAYHDRGPIEWWGRYAAAVSRWENVLGRYAPAPTCDRGRLSPAFVEWMMGLPEGHVTGVPGVSPAAMLRCLGNGVVPQQAATAIRQLLTPPRKEHPWTT